MRCKIYLEEVIHSSSPHVRYINNNELIRCIEIKSERKGFLGVK